MSTTIDERVVEMKFDNKNFEKNVSTTMSTLDRLKAALNFKSAEKSFDDLGRAADRFSLDGMGRAIENISDNFNVMGAVAFSVIQRIVNEAITAGKRMEQAMGLGMSGISSGWAKYGDKNTSVATLAGQGYDMSVIEEQLAKLNSFTDETSYNFVDMVSNIGKFTASGQTLEDSVTAMMGIANWAAMSGQNAVTASRAMYQLSQAMGRGVVRMEDWKSIQNANMDTIQFREQAIAAAESLKVLEKQADGTYKILVNGSKKALTAQELFTSEGLTKEAWFTADVAMSTFERYSSVVDEVLAYADEHGITVSEAMREMAGSVDEFGLAAFKAAQEARTFKDVTDSVADAISTSWMKTFELLFGNYETSRVVFTQMAEDLYDIFVEPVNRLNELLEEGLTTLGGRENLSKALWNIRDALFAVDEQTGTGLGIISMFKTVWNEIFPEWTGERIYSVTEAIKNFTERLKPSAKTLNKLHGIYEGFISILDIGKQLIEGFGQSLQIAFGGTESLGDWLLNSLSAIGGWIKKQADALRASEGFQKLIQTVGESLKVVVEFGKRFFDVEAAAESYYEGGGGLGGILNVVFDKAEDVIGAVFDLLSKITGVDLSKIRDTIITIVEKIREIRDPVVEFINSLSPIVTTIWEYIKKIASGIAEMFGLVEDSPGEEEITPLEKAFETLGTVVSTFWDILVSIKDTIVSIFTGEEIEGAVNILGGLFNVLDWIVEKVNKVFSGIVGIIQKLGQGISDAIHKITLDDIWNMLEIVFLGKFVGGAFEETRIFDYLEILKKGVEAIVDSVASIWEVANGVYNSLNTTAILKFAGAVGILALSIYLLASIDADALGRSLLSVSTLLGEMVMVMQTLVSLSKGTTMLQTKDAGRLATAVLKIAASLLILAIALKIISGIGWDSVTDSLIAMGLALGIMLGAVYLLGTMKEAPKGVGSFITIAFSLLVLSVALKLLSTMNWKGMGIALISMAVAIGAMVGAILLMDDIDPSIIAPAFAMVLMAGAFVAIALALRLLATMDWKGMGIALISMASAFAILVGAIKLMDDIDPSIIAPAFAMALIAAAFAIVAVSLRLLATMDWKGMGIALISMASAFAILVGATAILAQVDPSSILGAVTVTILAAAFLIVAIALQGLSAIGWAGMGVALISMLGAFTILVGAAAILGLVSPMSVVNAITVLILSITLGMVANALVVLSSMDWKGMGIALVSMLGAMAILVGATAIISLLPPTSIAGVAAFVLVAEAMVDVMETLGQMISSIMSVGDPDKAIAIAGKLEEFLGLMGLVIGALGAVASIGGGLVGGGMVLAGVALVEVAEAIRTVSQALVYAESGIRGMSQSVTPESLEKVKQAAAALFDFGVQMGKMHVAGASGIKDLQNIADPLALIFQTLSAVEFSVMEDFFPNMVQGVVSFSDAVTENTPIIIETFRTLMDDCISAVDESEWFIAGSQAIYGFVNGFNARVEWAKGQVASGMASIAAAGAAALEVNSPSKLFASYGEYSVLGYVKGFEDEVPAAERALQDTMLKIADYMDGNRDFDPVIRPVLDLSNVQAGAARIGGYFSATQAVGIAARMNSANAVNAVNSDDASAATGVTYSFVQNNYSPKALNRLEIYRQTRNQISAIEGAMRAV